MKTHAHSKTCRKYKNLECRFNFGHFFTEKTIIAKLLAADMDELHSCTVLKRRHKILSKVMCFINEALNSSKKKNFNPHLTIDEILRSLNIDKNEYYEMLSISGTNDFEIHLKRPPYSCFINNYNPALLSAWQANMDIQPVLTTTDVLHTCVHLFQKMKHNVLKQFRWQQKKLEKKT